MIIISLLIAGCAHQNSIAKKKHEWLFAHIAPQGNVGDGTTIVMPVTQDFIAFTIDPYTVHSNVNVNEFISLIDKSNFSQLKAEDLMNKNPLTALETDNLQMAENRMREAKVQCLIVKNKINEVVGVIQIFE